MVSNVPLREEFERRRRRGEISAAGLSKALGWTAPCTPPERGRRPDAARLRVALGLCQYNPSHGYPPRRRERITDDVALKIAAELRLDPVEVGL